MDAAQESLGMAPRRIFSRKQQLAVAIPCHNEATTITGVVQGFHKALPDAAIYVFDNASTDASTELASKAGAEVRRVAALGKGNVLRAIFDELREDVIVVVDGDDTYFADDIHALIAPVLAGEADMVVGERLAAASDANMKRMNQ